VIGRERLDLVATVWDEAEESLHPVGVILQRANIGERFGLRRKAGIRLTEGTARLPALAGLAGLEERLRRLGDRRCFRGGRHDRPPHLEESASRRTARSYRPPVLGRLSHRLTATARDPTWAARNGSVAEADAGDNGVAADAFVPAATPS